jgi:hypothetical protein
MLSWADLKLANTLYMTLQAGMLSLICKGQPLEQGRIYLKGCNRDSRDTHHYLSLCALIQRLALLHATRE